MSLLNSMISAAVSNAAKAASSAAASKSSGSSGSKASSGGGGSKSSSGGGSKSNGSNSSSGGSSNYHQDAIDAAARGDWNAVSTALANRQAKIDAQGGNDRGTSNSQILSQLQAMYGGNSSGSSGTGKTTKFNGIDYTTQPGTGIYGVLQNNSEVKNYTQGGVHYKAGADMSRRTDLAGKVVVSNGYTVFYDDDGYATKAVKGSVDYTPTMDEYAKNGTYNTKGAWTDQEVLTPADQQKIMDIRAQMQAGKLTGDQANAAANAIRAGYGYSIDKNGYVTDFGALSTVNDRRAKLGLGTQGESAEQGYFRYLMGTDTTPEAYAAGKVQDYGKWYAENGRNYSPSGTFNPTLIPTTPQNGGYGSGGSDGPGWSGSGNGDSVGSGAPDLKSYLDQWLSQAQQQQTNTIDYGTAVGINDLVRAEEDAAAQYQTQRNQIAIDEAKAKDNQALYAEARGDKGGIGAAQYDSIMNTAAQNRLAVNSAQTKLSTDTARQIADLRAQGEYEKADALLEIGQTYLSQLMSLEQWAAEYNLSVAQFNASLEQWAAEFDLSVGELLGTYNGQQTMGSKQFEYEQEQDRQKSLSDAGGVLLSAGIMPSSSQLSAMGMTTADAQNYIAALQAQAAAEAAAKRSSSSGGGDTPKATLDIEGLFEEAAKHEGSAHTWLKQKANYSKYGLTSAPSTEEFDEWLSSYIPTFSAYSDAAAFISKSGGNSAGLMTQAEWTRHKNSGNDKSGASEYKTYKEYLNDYVSYAVGGGD